MSAEGRLITGRYRLEKQIGSGAMGVVWRAVDERLHRTVAVKQLLLQPGFTPEETEEARQRSMREGRIAARLQHQNAIVVFDVAEDDGQPVLVMEYLPSKSLATVLADQGPLPPQSVARIGSQVAGALAAAHMAGIVHRDLKPGNILLGDNGEAKITDFGISRAIGDVSVTKSGILAGTPAYLSPEVALGRDPAPASDVFSLGATLYAAIEGEPPFGVDENAISLLHRVARGQVEPPRQAGPLTSALMELLRADPVDRPTMATARNLLQAVADGRPVPSAAPPSAGWQHPPAANATRQGAAPAEAPRTAYAASNPPNRSNPSNPPTQVGEPARAQVANRSSWRPALLWMVAVLAAILIGVLGANAFGLGGGSEQNPDAAPATRETTQQQAPPPAPPASPAPPPTSEAEQTTSAAPSSEASSAPAKASVTQEEIKEVVKDYFSLVPDKLEKSWKLLGPGLKAQGKEKYKSFWNSVEDVEITAGPQVRGAKVVLQLKYTTEGGNTSTERHVLGMAVQDGDPVINSDSRG
ncbi:serine/threonine-protein kinase [Parasphingorhabdus pacifica]